MRRADLTQYRSNRDKSVILRFRPRRASMRPTKDAIEHCKRHIERKRTEIETREKLGQDAEPHRNHLKTLESLLGVHEATRDAAKR